MSKITELQNSDRSVQLLFTQRKLYSIAKNYYLAQTIVAVIAAVLFPIVAAYYPNLRSSLAIASLIFLLSELFIIEPAYRRNRLLAAKFQELFDTEALGIKWNHLIAGAKPDIEILHKYIGQMTVEDKNKLLDWYPVSVSKLPSRISCIICQRANIWWDFSLRKAFRICLIILIILLSAIMIYFNLHNILTIVLQNILPFLPLIRIAESQIRAQESTMHLLEKLKTYLDDLIEKCVNNTLPSDDISDNSIRSIQDEIFRHRSTTLFVPDRLYYFCRNDHESSMIFNAEDLVSKILTSDSTITHS